MFPLFRSLSQFSSLLTQRFPQIEEVQGVHQVMDQEEEIALQEFAKFEEKLKAQRGGESPPSTVGKGSLDTVPG